MEYGLIGETLSHSYSKWIHNAFGNDQYELYSISKDELADLLTKRAFKGLNVTIPYKKAVIPFCDALSDAAKKIGSVNTLVKMQDGTLYGDNTDYDGFLYAAKRAGIVFSNKKVMILGSGGTSLTVQTAVRDALASQIIVVSRSGPVNYHNMYEHADTEILINTTPVGMYPNTGESLVDLDRFPNITGVIDVIYNPFYTKLLLDAHDHGISCSNGLPMLVAQAAKASERFFSTKIADDEVQHVYQTLASDVSNIVLVGMPGSGKTSIGKLIAEQLQREFIDTDTYIERQTGMTIPELFSLYGEERFRMMESEAVNAIGKEHGKIIATGGGIVLHQRNYAPLKQNGRLYYLERDIHKLAMEGRPLSKNFDALQQMKAKRMPLYQAFADCTIENQTQPCEAAQKIVEDFYETIGD